MLLHLLAVRKSLLYFLLLHATVTCTTATAIPDGHVLHEQREVRSIAEYFENRDPSYPYYDNGNYNSSKGIQNRNRRGVPDVSATVLRLS